MTTDELIQQLHDSLQRELKGGFDYVNRRLDLIEARLGAKADCSNREADFSLDSGSGARTSDKLVERDRRIDALEARLSPTRRWRWRWTEELTTPPECFRLFSQFHK
jgi:BMFP domain-containing protein YqiC